MNSVVAAANAEEARAVLWRDHYLCVLNGLISSSGPISHNWKEASVVLQDFEHIALESAVRVHGEKP